MRKPGDESPERSGGHAADRLREQLRDRFGEDSEALPDDLRRDEDPAKEDEPEAPEEAGPKP